MKPDYAARARALVGVRFRPQGRAPGMGLDCVGLVICAFSLQSNLVRSDYRLRGDHLHEILAGLAKAFRRIAAGQRRNGDVLVLQVARDQLHLAILTAGGFIHADARLGRVVETPGPAPWPLVAVFRRRTNRGRG